MFDISQWTSNNMLEDFQKKPVKINIVDFSERFDIFITIQTKKKEEAKHGK